MRRHFSSFFPSASEHCPAKKYRTSFPSAICDRQPIQRAGNSQYEYVTPLPWQTSHRTGETNVDFPCQCYNVASMLAGGDVKLQWLDVTKFGHTGEDVFSSSVHSNRVPTPKGGEEQTDVRKRMQVHRPCSKTAKADDLQVVDFVVISVLRLEESVQRNNEREGGIVHTSTQIGFVGMTKLSIIILPTSQARLPSNASKRKLLVPSN